MWIGRLVVLGVAVVAVGAGVSADAASAPGAVSRCRVSTVRPLSGRTSFNYGNRGIAVALPPHATYVAVPEGRPGWAWLQSDGWIRTKVGWWTAHGKPRVTGRRTDGAARSLRVDVGSLGATSTTSFYPSALFFPSTGCWRITATARGARLVANVNVVTRA